MTQRIEAYEAIKRPAREAYQAIDRSGREVCEAVKRSAWGAYRAVERPVWEAYQAIERPAREAYGAIERAARDAYQAVERSAWEGLACGDPLVDWIVTQCADYREAALIVLRALPADLDSLEHIAADEEWCKTWEALRDDAISAGVIS